MKKVFWKFLAKIVSKFARKVNTIEQYCIRKWYFMEDK